MVELQRIAIIGNGEFVPCFQLISDYDMIVALDGGIKHCRRLNIEPTVVLGDGDSKPTDTTNFELITDQTTTDLQKGLAWVQHHLRVPHHIDLFSVTSHTRLDHTLAAIQLLQTESRIQTIYTPTETLRLVRNQLELALPIHTQLSLLPVGDTAAIHLTGTTWQGDFLLNDHYSGLSNQTNQPQIAVTVKTGIVLMVTEQSYQ